MFILLCTQLQEAETATALSGPQRDVALICRYCSEVFLQQHLRLRHIITLHFDHFITSSHYLLYCQVFLRLFEMQYNV